MFVESSSMINLTCLVAWTAKPPDKVERKFHLNKLFTSLLRWSGFTMVQR